MISKILMFLRLLPRHPAVDEANTRAEEAEKNEVDRKIQEQRHRLELMQQEWDSISRRKNRAP